MAGGGDFSVAILAGGRSSRMGSDKALLELGGRPVVELIADNLDRLGRGLFISGGDPASFESFGLPVCADQYELTASLVGIYSALAAAWGGGCIVVACDLPFADRRLAALMARLAAGHDAVIPVSEKGPEPLFAYYSKACLGSMRRAIEAGDLRVMDALADLDIRLVATAEVEKVCDPQRVFFNVNTPGQLAEAERMPGGPRETGDVRTPLVCFVGRKDSGKTTLIEKLAAGMVARGLEVAYIKHDVHGFEMDREGTDTWRVAAAGARRVVISSPDAVASIERRERERDLEQIRDDIGAGADIVIAEGFKSSCADRIEVSLSSRSRRLACPERELVAVVSDRPDASSVVPVLDIDDTGAVLRFLLERYGLRARGGETLS